MNSSISNAYKSIISKNFSEVNSSNGGVENRQISSIHPRYKSKIGAQRGLFIRGFTDFYQ
jgi:hypothetical protein